jgi:heat shock protein HtpX
MREMFEEVRSNKIKSYLLVSLFVIIITALGLVLGLALGMLEMGLLFAFIIAVGYSLIAYSSGDSMVLKATGSRPVTKKQYPHLYHTIEGLAIAAGIPKPKAYVIDDTALNAFATGKDPQHASISVTTGLLDKLNRQELEGVIGHEMAHIQSYDTRIMVLAAVLVGVVILISDIILRSFLWGGRVRVKGKNGGSFILLLIVIGILFAALAPFAARLIRVAISRRREYAADAGSAILTRYPPGLASALEKISKDPDPLVDKANRATAHLFISTPFRKKRGWLVGLFSTHPPISDRIHRLKEM